MGFFFLFFFIIFVDFNVAQVTNSTVPLDNIIKYYNYHYHALSPIQSNSLDFTKRLWKVSTANVLINKKLYGRIFFFGVSMHILFNKIWKKKIKKYVPVFLFWFLFLIISNPSIINVKHTQRHSSHHNHSTGNKCDTFCFKPSKLYFFFISDLF